MNELKHYLDNAKSPYHTARYAIEQLMINGFSELKLEEKWDIVTGGKYFVNGYNSTVYAFNIGENPKGMLKIAAAHTDYPCFRLKPGNVIKTAGGVKLNIEPYGGMIFSTWLDRPLSVAGLVCVKGESTFDVKEIYFDFNKPVMIIPNLAIHMNRNVNSGVELNAFNDMMPLCAINGEEITADYLYAKIADHMGVDKDDILSFDLCVYVYEEAKVFGFNDEYMASKALDNVTSVYACVNGIINAECKCGINFISLYDNEEVGSMTKNGAQSALNEFVIEKIAISLGYSRDEYLNLLMGGMLLSCDVAHGVHPNKTAVTDPTVNAKLGGGVVIKMNYNQKYPTDPKSVGIVSAICKENEIAYQQFMNRADKAGGSTIGAIVSSNMAMRAVDIGVPILAMHSACESMALSDQEAINELVVKYFEA